MESLSISTYRRERERQTEILSEVNTYKVEAVSDRTSEWRDLDFVNVTGWKCFKAASSFLSCQSPQHLANPAFSVVSHPNT